MDNGLPRSLPPRVHLLGIGGVGMSALGGLLHAWGHEVSGADAQESHFVDRLRKAGVDVHRDAPGAPPPLPAADLVIRSPAVPEDAPPVQQARALGIEVLTRAEALGRMLDGHSGIGVAGTHGKTTTTAMTAAILLAAGRDPTFIIGGRWPGWPDNYRNGGPSFLFEACEGFGALQETSCDFGCVLNVDDDHVEQFVTEERLRTSFMEFIGAAKKGIGLNGDDPTVRALGRSARAVVSWFGLESGCDVRATNLDLTPGRAAFTVNARGTGPLRCRLPVGGLHHVYDALGAITLGLFLGVPLETAVQALGAFEGVHRRFEAIGSWAGAAVFDDYAHHPTEVTAALAEGRRIADARGGRLVAIFQPHLGSRTERLADRFAEALSAADLVLLGDVYAARTTEPGLATSELIAAPLGDRCTVRRFTTPDHGVEVARREILPRDAVLVLGAGDVTEIGRALVARL